MKFIIGYKQQMTQSYREDGTVVPVTVVQAAPVIVTQVKTPEKEGYSSVQLGIGEKNKAGKSQSGHISEITKTGRKPFARLREVRVDDASGFKVGDTISASVFAPGDKVFVTGTAKGRGFQGVVKRHGFHGSPKSHGHKDQLRMPGSIGSQDPQRVFKGTKMGGRMGGNRVTVKNLEIVSVDPEKNLLYVKGALPGARNSLIYVHGEGEFEELANLLEAPAKKEAPKEEAVKEEAKPEEAPKEEAAEAKPEAEAPAKEAAPKEETPKEEPVKEEAKAEEKPAEESK